MLKRSEAVVGYLPAAPYILYRQISDASPEVVL